MLGRKESVVYLLKGNGEYALIGGGMIHIVPEVLQQLEEFNIEEERIKRLMILHSHFDHCGIVPFFKKRWPWAVITASERARELLSTPDVIDSIAGMNQMLLAGYNREKEARELGFEFAPIAVEEVVYDGDQLRCGDLTLEVLEVPGHSSCSIAVYVAEEKALFASDAGGIPFGENVFAAANSNFDLFQESLEKMAKYDVEVHLAEHYGAFTGEDGRNFLRRTIESARETRKLIEETYARNRDVQKTTEEITNLFMGEASEYFLPRDIISMVVGQMTRFIAKKRSRAEQ